MGLMQILVNYVKGAFHAVSSDELVNVTVYHGYDPTQARGAVVSSIRLCMLLVVDTVRIKGRKINFFQ